MRPSRYPPTNSLPPVDVAGVITLDQVRLQPRKQNEYVDTPRSPHTSSGGKFGSGGNATAKNTIVTLAPSRERVKLPNRTTTTTTQSGIVRTQPVSISPPLKKDLPVEVDKGDSIICSQCGKCRCGACTSPRQLPSKWLCGDKVNVSPETCVDYVTCVCLVKGVFYHCSKDDQDAEFECVTDPCACCNRPNCCTRWTCILAMSLCLPCMCLYPPAKCGLMACTGLYNKCRKKGCTCNNKSSNQGGKKSRASKLTDSSSQYRGLLIESDRESSSVSNT